MHGDGRGLNASLKKPRRPTEEGGEFIHYMNHLLLSRFLLLVVRDHAFLPISIFS